MANPFASVCNKNSSKHDDLIGTVGIFMDAHCIEDTLLDGDVRNPLLIWFSQARRLWKLECNVNQINQVHGILSH